MKSTQAEYWNSVSTTKNFNSNLDLELFQKMVSRDGPILDIGCGYGTIFLFSVFETIVYQSYVGTTMNGNSSNRFRYVGRKMPLC